MKPAPPSPRSAIWRGNLMPDYCRFIRDPDVPGGRYHVPGCWTGVFNEIVCDCEKAPRRRSRSARDERDDLAQRVSLLEEQLDSLREQVAGLRDLAGGE